MKQNPDFGRGFLNKKEEIRNNKTERHTICKSPPSDEGGGPHSAPCLKGRGPTNVGEGILAVEGEKYINYPSVFCFAKSTSPDKGRQ